MSLCPSSEQLLAYLDGSLESTELDQISEHLDVCETCVATLVELEAKSPASSPLLQLQQCGSDDQESSDLHSQMEPLLKSVSDWAAAATDPAVAADDPSSHESHVSVGESDTTIHHSQKPRRRMAVGLKPGQMFGAYEIMEELAHGGMGVVYKARQTSLNRIVALKTILGGRMISPEEVKRFENEALSAARLQHPNIVAIHEVNEVDGQCYFSMDYVEGRDLSEIVHDCPLTAREAAQYGKNMAEAIQYAHDQGVLHRDLKPSNVMIDRQNNVRITDFGLAKQLDHDTRLTATGQVMGTPSYMSPEQAAGRHEDMGPTSDVYSLGAILYESITARPPFRAETSVETLKQVQECEPPSPRMLNQNIPRDLETICLKCLEKSPSSRYPSAHELAEDLDRYLTGQPILARPVSPAGRLWRWCRRNTMAAIAVILVLLILLAVPVGSVVFVVYDVDMQRQSAVTNMESLADVTGSNCIAAIDFDDPDNAIEELRSLVESQPRIKVACLYRQIDRFDENSEHELFVKYPSENDFSVPVVPGTDSHQFKPDSTLELFSNIHESEAKGGQQVGIIFLNVDVQDIDARFKNLLIIVSILFLGSALAAIGFLYAVYRFFADSRRQLTR